MSDLPTRVHLTEEGPREGFQIEKGPITTERKIAFIDAVSGTGLTDILTMSFVHPKRVPGMADAEAVVAGIAMKPGITYRGLWLNEQGLHRAIATGRLTLTGQITMSGSDTFVKLNQNRTPEEHLAATHALVETYKGLGIPVERGFVAAAFGSNFDGDVAPARVVELVHKILDIAAAHDVTLRHLTLADTMAWATPMLVKRTVGAVREACPELELTLHLHDTRGMGIANAFAGLEMGVARYDSSIAGLGGCPFAGHAGAAGNVCTEDLVFMCDEMGIETGADLDALIECARFAEEVVGHPLPGAVMRGGSLRALRDRIGVAA